MAADSVLDPARLDAALAALPAADRRALVDALERLAQAGAATPAPAMRRSRRSRAW